MFLFNTQRSVAYDNSKLLKYFKWVNTQQIPFTSFNEQKIPNVF